MSSHTPSSKSPQRPISAELTPPEAATPPSVPPESATPVRSEILPGSDSTNTMISAAPPIEPVGEKPPTPLPTAATDVEVDLSYRAPPSIAWRSLPLRDEGLEGWLTPLLATGLAWLTYQSTGSVLASACIMVVLLGICSRGFLPTVWEVGREGVTSKRLGITTKHRWRMFAGHQLDRRGVLLLPYRDPLPWQYLRGVHIPWGPHQDQLLALVTHYMGPPLSESSE